ncbi:hypothetical protein M422DRAFT_65895 [Sphaerobolus stellatus SS14]|nr:hypothetical protein M422DRAFT_65895 [Sphaerobolus stellatus SS14]
MSAQKHVLEYAKTSRAKCQGPCNRGSIAKGELRYGKKYQHPQYGVTTSWMHWECASSALGKLASVKLESVPGFRQLLPEDQQRVRRDVSTRKIGPRILPQSENTPPSSSQSRGVAGPSSSQAHRNFSTINSQAIAGQKRKAPPAIEPSAPQIYVVEDNDENFDNTQEEVKDELYITLASKVVGLQYYQGMVGPGEEVTLVREPHNRFDSNAIQVLNISGEQVGHLPRNIAAKLSPLMDRDLITVEGVIHQGNIGKAEYSMAINLKIYGASHRRPELERELIWATPKQRGFTDAMRPAGYRAGQVVGPSTGSIPVGSSIGIAGPSRSTAAASAAQIKVNQAQLEAKRKSIELQSILSGLKKVDDEGRRSSLLDIVCPVEDILNLPTHPSPPSVASGELKVNLLRHQSQALRWCIERENPVPPSKVSDPPVQFWQFRTASGKPKGFYWNLTTNTPQDTPPLLDRGGLMADAMGLGKTLTMLSLIIATKKDVSPEFSNSTLIVVPLSVLSNWRTQIEEHLTPDTLSFHVYYEAGRNISPEKLANYDVVITTYQVVVSDLAVKEGVTTKVDSDGKTKKKQKAAGGLFDIKWKRIILDEAHTIRNPKTKMAIALRELAAQRRWAVTGTPIINSPKDLGSLLQFLRICRPLDNDEFYNRLVIRRLRDCDPAGTELLRALMSHICIRRTKEMQNSKGESLVPLPPVEMTLIPVQLDPVTRKLYDEVEALSQQRFASLVENSNATVGRTEPTNVLSLITRLRQITLHAGLVPRNYLEQLRSMNTEEDKLLPAMPMTPADRVRLQAILSRAVEDREECPICFDIANDPRITPCSHVYCFACIVAALDRDERCPMDRRTINVSDLIEPLPPTDLTQAPPLVETEDDDDLYGSSAKIDQLIHLLKLTPSTEKSLVFSQFTGFLDKIGEALEQNGIPYVRFDGQMSARRRQEVLERFSKPLVGVAVRQDDPLPSQRRSRSSAKIVLDSSDFDRDSDFIPAGHSDGDNSFIDDSDDDDSACTSKGKGKGKAKAKSKSKARSTTKAMDDFDIYKNDSGNPVVMLISLKAGALGLNLTVANNVYLMDPWWQEGIESQAIDRCNRIGQKKPVHVYQLVAENTVEAKVLEIQEKKKNLIKQAFSGIKTNETPRQKKEARLQDLIELFGIRRNQETQA